MKNRFILCLLALMLTASTAMAESITLDGTVVSTRTDAIIASHSGVVSDILAAVGDPVAQGDELVTMYPSYVCADQAGTVTLYGAEGDAAEAVATRWGAIVSIEPDIKYTVSASTQSAYDDIETKIVHEGETVCVVSASSTSNRGLGIVNSISGTSYAVEVQSGTFEIGESVAIYRGGNYVSTLRVGKGSIARNAPVAYTGTGTIGKIYVQNGDHVEAGDILYETLAETPASIAAYGGSMVCKESGIVAEINVSAGDSVAQGAVLVKVYPHSALRLEVPTAESDLSSMKIGSTVEIEFTSGARGTGTVERISNIAQTATSEDSTATYNVYITFTSEDTIRCGMTASITTVETNTK